MTFDQNSSLAIKLHKYYYFKILYYFFAHVHQDMHVKVRGHLVRVISLLPALSIPSSTITHLVLLPAQDSYFFCLVLTITQ